MAFNKLANLYGPDTRFLTWVGDIKEMYDFLPQKEIKKAIKYILIYVQRTTRRKWINVNMKKI
jgi:hypothetical protein